MTGPGPVTRRGLLAFLGAGATAAVAGCSGAQNRPKYERGEVDAPADAEERSAEEMAAAAALAQREPNDDVASVDELSLEEHEFVLEDGYLGSTVQGIVENRGDQRVRVVEVRVRVYNDADELLGRYFASTGDLDAGERWRFTVVLLESPADVAGYDIAALGSPS